MVKAETALGVLERTPAEGFTSESLSGSEERPGDALFPALVSEIAEFPFELDQGEGTALDQCEERPRLLREPTSGPWQHRRPVGVDDYVPVLTGVVILIESRNHVAKYSGKRVATGDLDRTTFAQVRAGGSVICEVPSGAPSGPLSVSADPRRAGGRPVRRRGARSSRLRRSGPCRAASARIRPRGDVAGTPERR